MRPQVDESNSALLTRDGNVTGISHQSQRYPYANARGYETRVLIPLTPMERRIAEMAQQGEAVSLAILRSAPGQLSVDACHEEHTQTKLTRGGLEVTTLVAVLQEKAERPLLQALRDVPRARLAYALLAPHASRCGDTRVEVEPVEYTFNFGALGKPQLERIFHPESRVSARSIIEQPNVRTEQPLRSKVASKEFLVCGLQTPHVLNEHWILHPWTRVEGKKSALSHGGAVGLAAGRPEIRQAELINTNGKEELVPTTLFAERFRACISSGIE